MTQKRSPRFSINKSHRNFTNEDAPRYFDNGISKSPPREHNSFKVVTYNIRFGKRSTIAADALRQDKALKNIDAVCLQEMDVIGVERIAQALKMNYIYYPAVLHPAHNREFGNAVLTRWPILQDKKLILPHLDEKKLQRIAVGALIEVKGRPVWLYSVHTKVFLTVNYRMSQTKAIIDSIPKNVHYSIVAGDFNTFTRKNFKAVTDVFLDCGYLAASDEVDWTFRHWAMLNRKTKLDHIFVRGLKPITATRVLHKKASDHMPVLAELAF